jgi:ABC-type multidrug transport system permease subunit
MSQRPLPPLVALTQARVLEFVREPEALFWVFVFPILMALALGIAFRSRGPQLVIVGVVDQAGAPAVVETLRQSRGITVKVVPAERADAALRNGNVELLVVAGDPPTYRYDPARTEGRLARLLVHDALMKAGGRVDLWTPRENTVMVPGSRYIDWLIPGLLGMNIMGTGMWGIGFAVVQARTRKLLKLLLATPMRRSDYLLAQMFGRLTFLALEVVALLAFARIAFGVSSQGSLAAVIVIAVVGAVTFSGLGLLVASRARTVEGVSGLLNVVMMPMWLLSGVFFSAANFPERAQPFIRLLPLTALNEALRGVMVDGTSMVGVSSELGILAAWGIASFGLALAWFRWQ